MLSVQQTLFRQGFLISFTHLALSTQTRSTKEHKALGTRPRNYFEPTSPPRISILLAVRRIRLTKALDSRCTKAKVIVAFFYRRVFVDARISQGRSQGEKEVCCRIRRGSAKQRSSAFKTPLKPCTTCPTFCASTSFIRVPRKNDKEPRRLARVSVNVCIPVHRERNRL